MHISFISMSVLGTFIRRQILLGMYMPTMVVVECLFGGICDESSLMAKRLIGIRARPHVSQYISSSV